MEKLGRGALKVLYIVITVLLTLTGQRVFAKKDKAANAASTEDVAAVRSDLTKYTNTKCSEGILYTDKAVKAANQHTDNEVKALKAVVDERAIMAQRTYEMVKGLYDDKFNN